MFLKHKNKKLEIQRDIFQRTTNDKEKQIIINVDGNNNGDWENKIKSYIQDELKRRNISNGSISEDEEIINIRDEIKLDLLKNIDSTNNSNNDKELYKNLSKEDKQLYDLLLMHSNKKELGKYSNEELIYIATFLGIEINDDFKKDQLINEIFNKINKLKK